MQVINLSPDQLFQYRRDGFLIIRNVLSATEADRLHQLAQEDELLRKHAFDLNDQTGKKTKLTLWYKPGNDPFGLLSRSYSITHVTDQLMEGDAAVCHFHSKLMQKEPRVGGAWEWHQDYGYWYKNEFLLPDQMISVMVAITQATRENGCLQVIRGSHKMGRVEHGFAGEQVGASMHFVNLALQSMEHLYVELEPGDVLFFHPNLLHRSEANLSNEPRWSLISCYNRQSNRPYNEPSGQSIIPVEVYHGTDFLDSATALGEEALFLQKEQDEALK